RLELLAARAQETLRRARVLQDAAPARRPDPPQLIEHGVRHRAFALAAVELDREAVRLVAHALEQLELDRVVREAERRAPAWHEHLLDPLREAHHGHPERAELVEDRQARGQLS